MNIDPQDPKWTAYVLDELDPAEREEVQRELAAEPEAQILVAEISATVGMLATHLQAEPAPSLSDDQRANIAAKMEVSPAAVPQPTKRRARWLGYAAALAASVLIAGMLIPALQSARESGSRRDEKRDVAAAPGLISEFESRKDQLVTESIDLPETSASDDMLGRGYAGRASAPLRLQPDPRGKDASGYTIQKPTYEKQPPRGTAVITDATGKPTGGRVLITEEENERLSLEEPAAASVERYARTGRPAEPPDIQMPAKEVGSVTGYGANGVTIYFKDNSRPSGNGGFRKNTTNKKQNKSETRATGPANALKTDERTPIFSFAVPENPPASNEAYDEVIDNPFVPVGDSPLSTFSIDVDTASYANVRRYLLQHHALPPKGAVRIEELINYFRYEYPQPEGEAPFSAQAEVAGCPWNGEHRLVRIGLKGREIAREKRPPSNLVFLVDVSGSMDQPNKLPLVKQSLQLLLTQLGENDRVAIVVYAGASGLVLPSTTGDKKEMIQAALDQLNAGGSTNGAQGIQLAYEIAVGNFIKGGTNRVILATDGDFNVGVTDRSSLLQLITEKAKSGVFLTTLGFGMGNLKDGTLEQLADKGNGNYGYIDSFQEAKKLFVEQLAGTLITIAKDVKLQIEFNPAEVAAFRLIGYENRVLRHEDFNDDKKDAGEIGAGHTVTALYEIVPAGKANKPAAVDPLKYQKKAAPPTDEAQSGELLTLKLRYKQPDADESKLLEYAVKDSGKAYGQASGDFKFAAAVALFGMLLRDSPHKAAATFDAALELAQEGQGSDPTGYRAEFITLIRQAKGLK